MATETETVIFKIDTSEYEESLARMKKGINGLTDVQKELAKQAAEGNEEAAKSLERVNAQLIIEKKNYKATQDVLVGYNQNLGKTVDTVNFLNNSQETNIALSKQWTAQIKAVKVPSEQLKSQLKAVNDAINQQSLEWGDSRRNVGKYSEGILSAFKNIKGFGGAVSEIIDPLKAAKLGFDAAGGGAKGLGVALVATGIPLFVTVLNTLIDAFKTFKPVADAVEVSLSALGGVFDAITTGRNIFTVAEQAAQLTRDLQDLEDAQLGASIATAKFDTDIKKLLVQLKNKGNTYADNLKILRELDDAEKKSFELSSELAKEELRIEKSKLATKSGLQEFEINAIIERGRYQNKYSEEEIKRLAEQGAVSEEVVRQIIKNEQSKQLAVAEAAEKKARISDDDLKRIRDLQVKVIAIEGDSAVLREKIANRREAIENAESDRIKKIADERIKSEQASRKAFLDKIEALKSLDDILKKQDEDEKKRYANETERELNALVRREEITARRVGSVEALVSAELVARARLLQNESLTATERENIVRESEDRILDIKKRAAQETEKLQERELQNYQNQQQRVIDAVIQISSAVVNILGQASQFINQIAQENIDSLNEQLEAGVISQKTFDAETSALKLKAWKESKAIAITQASMNTANAVMAQLSNPTPYVGIVLAALAAATGAINIALIARQQPPKFAEGGKVIDIDGKPHSQGGTPIHVNGRQVAEAEKDEGLFIMKKNAYQKLKNYSDWNVAHGGNSWGVKTSFAALGGMVSDGGFTTREIANEANNAAMLSVAVREGLRSMPNPIVSVQEIDRVNNIKTKSVKVSQLG